MGQARAKSKASKKARQNLHNSWTHYVDESIRRWKTFAEDFTKKDAAQAEELETAREALQEACKHLDDTKELHSKQDAEDLEDAEMISNGKVEEDAMKVDSAEMIRQSISSVVGSLDMIRV